MNKLAYSNYQTSILITVAHVAASVKQAMRHALNDKNPKLHATVLSTIMLLQQPGTISLKMFLLLTVYQFFIVTHKHFSISFSQSMCYVVHNCKANEYSISTEIFSIFFCKLNLHGTVVKTDAWQHAL
jgi:hypothetical protein